MGRVMTGYECASQIVMSTEAAEALKKVQSDVKAQGYSLVVYDAYRPQRTVDTFVEWAKNDSDIKMKDLYYPTLVGSKEQLFEQGYIAAKSGHSRGSTVDLTIIPLNQTLHKVQVSFRRLPEPYNVTVLPFLDDGTIDMGSSFDLFHPISHIENPYITNPVYIANR